MEVGVFTGNFEEKRKHSTVSHHLVMTILFNLFLAAALCAGCVLGASYVWDSEIPARLQWLHNDGYCGEVSAIMAMLKYGQYMSQYDFRAISSQYAVIGNPSKPQQSEFYLVGSNDQNSTAAIKLNWIEYDHDVRDAKQYLAWVKKMVRKGYAVTICVYMNYYLFYGANDVSAGSWDYDHIVSVSRIESNYDDDLYHDDDVIVMEDHGLWAPRTKPIQYLFSYTFAEFPATREGANARLGEKIYSLPSSVTAGQFGIAHTGIMDDNGDCLPVRVDTNVNYEDPEIDNHSETRPASMEIKLTITVSGIQQGVSYTLYKYDNENDVPTAKFNANKAKAVSSITFVDPGTHSFVTTETIKSSQKVFYRCVRADAN